MSQPQKVLYKPNFTQGASGLQNSITVATVTVNAAATTGTASVPVGALVLGITPAGNQDQFVNSASVSGTTLTVTLKAAATATNTFKVTLLQA
jgi:hypothetical protein